MKTKIVLVAIAALAVGAFIGHGVSPIGPTPTTGDPGFEPIGPVLLRTDDRRMGVSCYRFADGSPGLACVDTGVGRDDGEPKPARIDL